MEYILTLTEAEFDMLLSLVSSEFAKDISSVDGSKTPHPIRYRIALNFSILGKMIKEGIDYQI